MKKETVENQLKIDIRDLKANGFKYGAKFTGKIFYNGFAIASFITDSYGLVLNYTYENVENISQYIRIDWLQCNYGNQRPYFLCPCCGKRVIALYCVDKHFHCRKCCNLAYQSQSESTFERLIRKSSIIEAKLQADSPATILDKPKGMHNTTYQRLLRQYNTLVRQF